MAYNPIAIANYFVRKSLDTGIPLTPMKLVKLVYIAHGWHLALTGNALIDEGVQAWKYGPVVSSVYHAFKHYADSQIFTPYRTSANLEDLDGETMAILDKVWDVYGNYNGLQLSTLTHQDNTPWDIVYNHRGGSMYSHALIPNDLIEQHYKEKVNARRASATPVG